MSDKFKNKYRIKSARLKNYDYSQNGMYFVTICTKNREDYFGEIKDGEIILNEIGKVVDQFWREIPKHFLFVKLDEFVIMPNHIHGNLEIIQDDNMETRFIATKKDDISRDAMNHVSTEDSIEGVTNKNNPIPTLCSLSNIIRWYKGRCSFEIRKHTNSNVFAWQPRFYDHIIRNEIELNKIREYIINNPKNWEEERYNIENVF